MHASWKSKLGWQLHPLLHILQSCMQQAAGKVGHYPGCTAFVTGRKHWQRAATTDYSYGFSDVSNYRGEEPNTQEVLVGPEDLPEGFADDAVGADDAVEHQGRPVEVRAVRQMHGELAAPAACQWRYFTKPSFHHWP